ncbi:hypothetical protein [Micromonospora sp. DT31]|uniref:hypothetical protein n=1 Tax=Micromonospora sp. DT31 TaxID=3393434 RepID=UPI003CE7827D
MNSISRRQALGLAGGVALAGAAGALTLPAAASAAGDWRRLPVITANIGRDVPRDVRTRAIRRVRHALDRRPLVGWQEIGEGDGDKAERKAIASQFDEGYRNVHMFDEAFRVPISVPTAYNVDRRKIVKVHGAFPEGPRADWITPPRYISEVILSAKNDPELKFAFLNTHFIAKAFNGEVDSFEDDRLRLWREHFRTLRSRINRRLEQGYPVIWTGDTNNPNMEKLHDDEERAFANGLDQIRWIEGSSGVEIERVTTSEIPLGIDIHEARVAILKLRRT